MAKSTVAVRFTGDTADLKRSVGQLDQSMAKVGTSAQQSGAKFAKFAKVGSLGLLAVGVAAKSAIDAGSDLNETLSKSNTVFKKNAKEIEDWADTAAGSFGQSKREALDAASSFGNMFTQLGIGEDAAADMSRQMTELASDFASFHNADITQVIEAQSAAFRGEYDALQRFVPTISAATVEQEALAMTGKTLTSELTAQEKALAVQSLMMKGAGDAAGDFDRTSSGLANQQRILSAQFEDVSAKLGQQLIPIALKVAGVFSTKVIPAIQWFVNNEAAVTAALALITAGFVAWAVSATAAAAASLAAAWPLLVVAAAAAGAAAVILLLSNRGEAMTVTFGRMVAAIVTLGAGFVRLAGIIGGAFGAVIGIFRTIGSLLNSLVNQVRNLIGLIDRIPSIPAAPGPGMLDPRNWFDNGGVMPGPRGQHSLAMVAGGETILPTHKPGFKMATAGTVVHVHVAGSVLSERDLVATINRAVGKGIR